MVKRLSCLPSKQAAGVRLPFGVFSFCDPRVTNSIAGEFGQLQPLTRPYVGSLAFRSLEDPWIILQLVRPIAGTAFITSYNAAATPQPYKMESYPSRRPHQIHVLYFSPSISPTFQCPWDSYHTLTFFQILQGEFTNHIFVSVFNGYPAPCNLNSWVDYMARLLLFSYQEPGWHFFPRARGL